MQCNYNGSTMKSESTQETIAIKSKQAHKQRIQQYTTTLKSQRNHTDITTRSCIGYETLYFAGKNIEHLFDHFDSTMPLRVFCVQHDCSLTQGLSRVDMPGGMCADKWYVCRQVRRRVYDRMQHVCRHAYEYGKPVRAVKPTVNAMECQPRTAGQRVETCVQICVQACA